MKIYAPDYYKEFKCIAGDCKHSCCVGWEIDIDDNTNEYYKTVSGDFGNRLKNAIAKNGDTQHFILSENERCPFLNKDNLCDIIINFGEDKLCQICCDHPRFRNFFNSRIEVGLGLCCEAAGKLLINQEKQTELIVIDDDNEEEIISDIEELFFNMRNKIFEIIKSEKFDDCIEKIQNEFNILIPEKSISEWSDIYLSLERLDEIWTDKLEALKEIKAKELYGTDKWERAFKELLMYFIYRHLPDGLYDESFYERIAFSILSVHMIKYLCISHYENCKDITSDDFVEISRMYSSEIEYCEENIEALLKELKIPD